MHPIYEAARADLEKKLAGLRRKGMGQSFSAHHVRTVLVQATDAVRVFQKRLGGHLESNGKIAATLGQRHMIEAIKKLEKKFTGHAPVLQAEDAAVFQKVYKRVQPALLNRFKKSEQLYGKPVVKKIRERLSLSVLTGDTVDEAVDRVAGVEGVFAGERWRAERIVRTELSYAYGVTKQRSYEQTAQELPDLQKKLIATFDERTGDDSKKLHGQVRKVDEPFVWINPHGEKIEYMQPPNRPNDREISIPWRPGWQNTAITAPGENGPGAVDPQSP